MAFKYTCTKYLAFVVEYEVNLLRLIDKLTNGTWLEVNETGTTLTFTPGSLIGGTLEHECCKLRGIGYYLEVVLGLAPFCKKALNITLRGVTNNEVFLTNIKLVHHVLLEICEYHSLKYNC